MGEHRRRDGALALLVGAFVAGLLVAAPSAMAVPSCTRFAAPGGSPGHPYTSVQQLVNSLGPGDVGCLAPGATFNETVSVLERPGTADKPFIVRSEDAARPATISAVSDPQTEAVVYIGPSASHFELQGVNVHALPHLGTPAITIAGDANAVTGADITNEGNGTCVQIGPSADRRASNARLDGDAIHSCGNPSGGHADGVSISYADGTTVTNSYIYGNPRHGITLFPDGQHSTISHNVIDRQHNGMGDGEGVQFAGDDKTASSNNAVAANLISDSEFVNIGYNWNDGSGTPGTGNDVRGNCISNSGNTAGEFQTDAATHQPVGYSQENNTVGSDPQYVNRDDAPRGYALSASSTVQCLGLGPLAAATTLPVILPPPDPEREHVFSASAEGEINPHLQSATFHFELGPQGSALTPLASQLVDPFGMPVERSSATVTGLKPKTTYSYRIVPDTPLRSPAGQTLAFTTAAAPKLAPPIARLLYTPTPAKKAKVRLPDIALRDVPKGAPGRITCTGSSACPFPKSNNLAALRLLRGAAFRSGDRIYIEVDQPVPIGRYRGRATTLVIGRPKRGDPAPVKSTDACVLAKGGLTPCLRPVAAADDSKSFARLAPLIVVGVPRGAKVDFKCVHVHGRCPKFPACRFAASRRKSITLLGTKNKTRLEAGLVFDVRFLKPDTQGLVARFTVHRRGRGVLTTQQNRFVGPGVQHSRPCRNA